MNALGWTDNSRQAYTSSLKHSFSPDKGLGQVRPRVLYSQLQWATADWSPLQTCKTIFCQQLDPLGKLGQTKRWITDCRLNIFLKNSFSSGKEQLFTRMIWVGKQLDLAQVRDTEDIYMLYQGYRQNNLQICIFIILTSNFLSHDTRVEYQSVFFIFFFCPT